MKLRHYLIRLIEVYQRHNPFFKRPSCVFYPTCSEYTKQAIMKYGVFKGTYVGVKRILRCHPWQEPQVDNLK